MNKPDVVDELSNILSEYNPAFSDGFAQRVMKNIESKKKNAEMEFYNIFRWVALSGVAAIIILLFTVYITEGSFSADALIGLMEYTSDEPLLTSVNF
jgi:hypothetical protein